MLRAEEGYSGAERTTVRIGSPGQGSGETSGRHSEERRLENGTLLAGRYRILDLVGRGGMGEVYRALDEQLGLCVALKVLKSSLAGNQETLERFRRELLLARQVSHRNAVRIHDIGQDGELTFLTMDFVEGSSLQALLRVVKRLDPDRAVSIARQVALALEAAHEAGIIHRDLKPSNVLLEAPKEGPLRAYLTDFGIARSLGSPGITGTGLVVGTLAYLSPEQARGVQVDGRSDLYSLGILLFEMLTGELPFAGGSAGESIAQRLTGSSRDLRVVRPDVPPRLAAIVHRLLERDPGRRFQSARELIEALDGWQRPGSFRMSRRLAAMLVLPVLLALGGAAFLAWDRFAGTAPPTASATAGPRPEVAVLPLVDETGRPDLAWLSGGIAEALAAKLGESPGLRVVSSARVFQIVEDLDLPPGPLGAADLRRLAELLDADRLVTGRVHLAGGRLRVDLSLVESELAGLPVTALHAEGGNAGEVMDRAGDLGHALRKRLEAAPTEASPDRATYEAQARAARQGGDPAKARKILAALLARDPHDVETRVELAEVCGEEGDLGAALANLLQVVAADPDHPRAWQLLGRYSILSGDSRRAVDDYLVRAMTVQNRLRSAVGQAEVLNALGVGYNDLGEPDLAAASYEKAAALRRRIGDERGLAATLRNLAAVHMVRGEQQRAGERLDEARRILERLGDPAGLADVANDLGLLAEEQGRFEEAIGHYRRSLELRRRLGQPLEIAESLQNVGYACYLLGRYDDARVYWQQGLDLYRESGDRAGVAVGIQGIGLLQTAQGEWDAALASFLESLDASRKLGLKEATAAALGHLGRVALLQGRFRAALASFEEALTLLRDLGDLRGQVEFTLAEAEAWMEIGDLDAAGQRLDAAGRLLAEAPNREQSADLLRLRGAWHLRRGETGPAREALQQAVIEAEASHGIVALLQARILQARLAGEREQAELRALLAEAEGLGHRALELQIAEALAAAELDRGDLAQSEAAARRGLEVARDSGAWAGAWRLHTLLARILERRGLVREAAGERAQATAELGRLRRDLTPEQRRPFEAIAEVGLLLNPPDRS